MSVKSAMTGCCYLFGAVCIAAMLISFGVSAMSPTRSSLIEELANTSDPVRAKKIESRIAAMDERAAIAQRALRNKRIDGYLNEINHLEYDDISKSSQLRQSLDADLATSNEPKEQNRLTFLIQYMEERHKKLAQEADRKAAEEKERQAKRAELLSQHGLRDENQYLTRGVHYVAVTQDALKRLQQLGRAGDTIGIVELLAAGLIYSIDEDTRVRVIGRDWGDCEVRIETGNRASMSGWVRNDRLWRP